MNDNGMGGRRVGKRYFSSDQHLVEFGKPVNIEEDTDWISIPANYSRLTEFEQLLADYKRDKKFIKSQKRKWLPPKPPKQMRKYEKR